MSENIASELKNWFLSLGFQDKNLSPEQIEEEFQRLSPPELRDIWRNVMIHVIPSKEVRYIRKVLMLHELNTSKTTKRKKLFITKNSKTLQELEQLKSFNELHDKLRQRYQNIATCENEIASFEVKVAEKELERKELVKKKEMLDHTSIMIDLKLSEREKMIKELSEMHSYLNYLISFWQAEKNTQGDVIKDRVEIVKDCLKNVHDFNKHQNILSEMDLLKEKASLMNDVIRLNANIPISSLYKIVIDMLKETLSSSIKLADYINSKQNSESSWLNDAKLTELKKNCVQYFLKNVNNEKNLQTLRDKVQIAKLELFNVLSDNNYMGFQKETFKIWLESECQKQCMVTRENYLRNEFDLIKNKADKIVDYSCEDDKAKFFADFFDINTQTCLSEPDAMKHINHLSDEPINMFIKCQNYCIKKIELFIEQENSEKLAHFADLPSQSLTNELLGLKQLELLKVLNNVWFSEVNECNSLPDSSMNICIEQCYYLIYLANLHETLVNQFNQSSIKSGSLIDKKQQIKEDQREFLNKLKKTIHEAKTNLKNVEQYASHCSKNVELWIKLSANDIVPKGMMVADREFVDWMKRYASVIQCLRHKNVNNNKTVF
ncbi:uncharacterized protein LOC135841080 [Planococcus citri]|uniref:uncharacterized protein LOC135841080 n=1 Tax=Planococcus citri TaxID=170843 RepID=UPI0031F8D7F5